MNRLILLIREEIQTSGPMTFARFMELALYAPGEGYYERRREIGKRGDYYTSVSVGPLFGELLAFQFAEWFGEDNHPGPVQIIEAGAHQGALAADILAWLERRRPGIFERLEYCLLEPSPTRRQWQEETLRNWIPKLKWFADISELAPSNAARIIFSNEFLDALPVHRLAWNSAQRQWEESRVAFEGGQFTWAKAAPSVEVAGHLPPIPAELAEVLPDGYVIEHSPAAVSWWIKAAAVLTRGKLLAIDYGFGSGEWLRPERREGTLRTYSQHHGGLGLLDTPGEIDITAHVNFSAIESAGHRAGLTTDAFIDQSKFLTQILAQIQAKPDDLEEWFPARSKQFQTLTHADHLGRAFRILIQVG